MTEAMKKINIQVLQVSSSILKLAPVADDKATYINEAGDECKWTELSPF